MNIKISTQAFKAYNENDFYSIAYMATPFGIHLHVRPVVGFSHMMLQTTRNRSQVCALGVLLTLLPSLGGQFPKLHFWDVDCVYLARVSC